MKNRRSYSWQDYEYAKHEWIRRHPNATPEEYDRAIAAIVKRLGL